MCCFAGVAGVGEGRRTSSFALFVSCDLNHHRFAQSGASSSKRTDTMSEVAINELHPGRKKEP